MKTLFICATPFHILNAINYVITNTGIYDICILPDFQNAEDIIWSLRAANIFENVFLLNETNNSYTKVKSAYRLITGNRYIRKLFKNQAYNKILYSLTNPVLYTLIVYELRKNNSNLECYFMEDGIGSYTIYLERITPRMRLLYKLLGKHLISENLDGAYFYKPELVMNDYSCKYLKLPPMDNIKNSPSILSSINDVLGYKSNSLYSRKVIYLNQPIGIDLAAVENRVLSIFAENGLNPVIKFHPRFIDNDSFKKYDIISDQIPLELVMLNDDMSDKILVTPFSTAALTSKLIFNQEPMVLFLYKLYHLDQSLPQIKIVEKFILSIKKIYSDQNRVQIPSTFDELLEIIESYYK